MMHTPKLCPAIELEHAAELVTQDTHRGLAAVDALLASYPDDARLHFLRGSLLAEIGDYAAAETAISHAVALSPGFAIARFRLGFLRLTSGNAPGAFEAWRLLHAAPAADPLRLFAQGLEHLARDEFEAARRDLVAGMARNTENPALNRDMALLLREMPGADGDDVTSSAHWLLQQDIARRTSH